MKKTNVIAGIALSLSLTGVNSASWAQQTLMTPAELPPASFDGPQYVDSTGCAFIRAGVGGTVTWVPRVTRDRQQVCGFQPSFPTTANAPVATQPPAPEVQVLTVPQPQPPRADPVVMRPASVARTQAKAPPTAVAGLVVTPSNAAAKGVSPQARVLPKHVYEQRKAVRPVKTPKGYRAAWQDDRLNLRRAEQTLAGHAEMRRIWTNTVPRRLID
ncbi:hypothetical protein [Roseobacter weihaiensis]|uniref:hypothetical protein n=1 Tax=Roseobacter weihaiensis TaxID=2763262 RepID=UPI001D09C43C|nr:hypothetical protein [Roseobacter sp. H9]